MPQAACGLLQLYHVGSPMIPDLTGTIWREMQLSTLFCHFGTCTSISILTKKLLRKALIPVLHHVHACPELKTSKMTIKRCSNFNPYM